MTKVQLFAYITGFVISMVYLAKRNVSVYHAVVIAMASCLVYSNISTAPFLHDDVRAIVENPDVQVKMRGLILSVEDIYIVVGDVVTNFSMKAFYEKHNKYLMIIFKDLS